MFRIIVIVFVVLLSLGLIACGGSDVGNPVFQPEIVNQTDNFSFQATGVTNVTQTLQYTWQNTGTRANIDQSSLITSGSATLTIRDAAGTQVFSAPLGSGATVVSGRRGPRAAGLSWSR